MLSALESLGAGALLAYLALPVVAWPLLPSSGAEAASRHRAALAALLSGAALCWLPALRAALPGLHPEAIPGALVGVPGVASLARLDEGGRLSALLQAVGALYLVGVALTLTTQAYRALTLGALLRRCTVAPEALCVSAWTQARTRGVPPPQVLLAPEGAVPFAVGALRPKVVLPQALVEALAGEPLALELVLGHELEHLGRNDQVGAALAAAARVLLPGHPTARRLLTELSLAREEAVDARVAPRDPVAYGHALLRVAELARAAPPGGEVAMAATALARRIDALARPAPREGARASVPMVVAAACAVLALLAPALVLPVPTRVELAPGQRATVQAPRLTRLAVGDPSVVEVTPLGPDALELSGLAPGETTIQVWTATAPRRAIAVVVK